MLSSLRNALVARGAALVLAGACAVLGGCSQEGTTPTCNANVTKDGIQINVKENPCANFARCVDAKGEVQPASVCCVDENDEPLKGYALTLCLYGYGEVDLDPAGSTGSGGSTSGSGGSTTSGSGGSTTSGSGTGGATGGSGGG